jgi:hypothetical protein
VDEMRYPAVGEIWKSDTSPDWEFECFYDGEKGYGFERKHDGYLFFVSKDQWNDNYGRWEGPKTVSDVLCFYVTPSNTIKATFYGDKNATGKPYFLKLMSDGELRIHEA